MNITITGSLGNISKPLASALVQKGHRVTVISSQPERQKDIEALGAVAATGSLEDVTFLTAAFTGADAVYCMVPPNYFFNHDPDPIGYYRRIAENYAQAIRQSGVRKVVLLSSFGADLDQSTGFILGSHYAEGILDSLAGVAVTHIRPVSFYYNLYGFIDMIKEAGCIVSNYGGDDRLPMVAPADIAVAVAEELEAAHAGRKIRYVASDERSCSEIAAVLGAAIGMPELQWLRVSGEQVQSALEAKGMAPHLAALLVELNEALHSGALAKEYYRHKPDTTGTVKLEDFAKAFAAAFHHK